MVVIACHQDTVVVQACGEETCVKLVRVHLCHSKVSVLSMTLHILTLTALCNPQCINGMCTDNHTCLCDSEWMGSICDKGMYQLLVLIVISMMLYHVAICDPPCQNEGQCTSPGVCACLRGWSGEQCEQGL